MGQFSEKKKHEIDRRLFLQRLLGGAAFYSSFPMKLFMSAMITQFVQKGYAQAAGIDDGLTDMKIVNLYINGGIARWYWDGVMTPNAGDLFNPNPMVISRFKNAGDEIMGEYATTRIGNYQMPWTWSANIPTASGGSVPMSQLAQNMLSLRGINTLIDSHGLNPARQIATTPGGISLTGLVADKARTPVPAIHRGVGSDFYGSEEGTSLVSLEGDDPFSVAMQPFLPTDGITGIKSNEIELAIDRALAQMSRQSKDKHKFLPASYQTRANAKILMKKEFLNLQSSFGTLRNKYTNLMRRSCSTEAALRLSGVDDVMVSGRAIKPFSVSGNDYFTGSNVNDIITENSSIDGMAEALAIAEFMIRQNLSSAFSFSLGGLNGTRVTQTSNKSNGSVGGEREFGYGLDTHFLGSHPALVMHSRYYRAFSAGLFEFIQQLKSISTTKGNVFNQTAIIVNSDFGRSAREDAMGSDQGVDAANYTIFSGMIKNLTVLGNIKPADPGPWGGSWGSAGGLKELGGRPAILGNCLSTVSAMVEVKTPMPNDQSFITKKDDQIVPVITSCKNIK